MPHSKRGLYWEEVGKGEKTLLMLHGGPGADMSSLRPDLDVLGEKYRLVFFDQPGCGKSWGYDHSLPSIAEKTIELAGEIGIYNPVLFGNSFGGFLAQEIALGWPRFSSALVLSSTSATPGRREVCEAFRQRGGERAARAADAFYEEATETTWREFEKHALPFYNVSPQPRRGHSRKDILFHFWNGEHREMNFLPLLENIGVPTLVISGSEDPITPPSSGRALAGAIPGADFHEEGGAGHGVWRDKPEEFFRVLLPWLHSKA